MRNRLSDHFPLLSEIRKLTRSSLLTDLNAGLIVGIMLVPQGMAYAFLAGMPPVYGLYAGLVPTLIYALLGTSRQLSIGPVAISAILVLAGVSQLATPFSPEYIGWVIVTGLLVGLVQILLGTLKLGFLVNFISHPVMAGFTSAAAIIIAVSQLGDIMGIEIPAFDHIHQSVGFVLSHLDEVDALTLCFSLGAIVMMLLLKKISKLIPAALIAVLSGIIISWVLALDQQGLEVIGSVPRGFPSFEVPDFEWNKIKLLLPVVFSVTVIGIVESISIARVLESKRQDHFIQPNRELIALGAAKVIGSFFQAIPTSGSFSRSSVNYEAKARSQLSSIFTVIVVGLSLLVLTPIFYFLPNAVLAAIILLAVLGLFDLKEAIHLYKVRTRDFVMMTLTFLVTLAVGIEEGVLAGVIFSILAVLYRSSRPNMVVLGKLPGTTYYRNIDRFDSAEQLPGKLIIRFENQIYFGNAAFFKDTVRGLIRDHPDEIKEVLLDAKSIHDIDTTGLKALREINSFLKSKDIRLYICGAVGKARDQLKKSGVMDEIGEERHYFYLHDAVTKLETD